MMGSLIHTKYKFEGYPIIFLLVVSLGGKQVTGNALAWVQRVHEPAEL